MNASSPLSAHWRSSKTITTGSTAAIRSKYVRHAEKSRSWPPGSASPTPSRASSAVSTQRRSCSSGIQRATDSPIRARVVASSSASVSPARTRTISPSAQNVIPLPYEGERPWCQ